MLRKLSWMVHVLLVGTWPSRSCVIDSCVKHGGVPLPRSGVRPGTQGGNASGGVKKTKKKQRWFEDYGEGFPKWSSSPLKHSTAGGGAIGSGWDLCKAGYTPVSFGAPPDDQTLIATSGVSSLFSGDDDSDALPTSGVVALSELDPEMTAMLSRTAKNVGLMWNPRASRKHFPLPL